MTETTNIVVAAEYEQQVKNYIKKLESKNKKYKIADNLESIKKKGTGHLFWIQRVTNKYHQAIPVIYTDRVDFEGYEFRKTQCYTKDEPERYRIYLHSKRKKGHSKEVIDYFLDRVYLTAHSVYIPEITDNLENKSHEYYIFVSDLYYNDEIKDKIYNYLKTVVSTRIKSEISDKTSEINQYSDRIKLYQHIVKALNTADKDIKLYTPKVIEGSYDLYPNNASLAKEMKAIEENRCKY